MKTIQRKLLLSISTFIFALLAFTGATVAWFNLSDEVAIEGFNMNISTGENLRVKMKVEDPDNPGFYIWEWVNEVHTEDIERLFNLQRIEKQGGAGYLLSDLRLEPLSSLDGIDFYNRQLMNAAGEAWFQNGNYKYNAPTTTYNSTHQLKYFELDLTFKSHSETTSLKVFLNQGGSIDDPLYPITAINSGTGISAIEKALRMAFVDLTQDENLDDVEPLMIYEQDARIQKGNSFDNSWLPENTHTFPTWIQNTWDSGTIVPIVMPDPASSGDKYFNVATSKLYTYTTTWGEGVYLPMAEPQTAGSWYDVATTTLYTATAATLPVQTTTSALFNFTSETEDNSFLFILAPLEERTIRIRIWIEGWDSSTTDALWKQTAAARLFTVSLNFKGIPQ